MEAKIADAKAASDKLKVERDRVAQSMQHEELDHLEDYLDRAQVSLKDLSSSAEGAWHELKGSIDELMERMSQSVKKLLGRSDNAA